MVGTTPNLAARLQELAQPGEVMISAATRRLIGNLFDCEDLSAQQLKGSPSRSGSAGCMARARWIASRPCTPASAR